MLVFFLVPGFMLTMSAQQTLTPELLWQLKRVSGTAVSPDGEYVVFGITEYDLEANEGNRDLYIVPVKGGKVRQLTRLEGSEWGECWRPDGQKIGFLSARDGSPQWYEINPDGSGLRQVTHIEGGIDHVAWSPAMHYLSFTRDVKTRKTVHELYPDLPKATGRIFDDLMYRHWDEYEDDKNSHIFYAPYTDGALAGEPVDIMQGEPYDVPMKPFGGSDAIAWSPDERLIAYSCKKYNGVEYAVNTNSDIYLYDIHSGTTRNLSEGMPGYDRHPVFSPDGSRILWNSMERGGFESDRNRIIILELANGNRYEATKGLDRDANSPAWTADGKALLFISGEKATYQIYSLDLETGNLRQITSGIHDYTAFTQAGDYLVATKMSMSHPNELYRVNLRTGREKQLDFANRELMESITWGRVESRWIGTTDGKKMLVWVIYPPGFDPAKKYPALLYCQGGPQSAVSQFFSFRWNFQIMAANGYIVVAPNRRGLPSFGREWNDAISRDWGGQAMKDYLTAIDTLAAEPWVDENRLGAVGASFGGYSVYWLAGNHQKRFKVFIAHDGVFNLESMYGSTEELWFVNWDLGGPYWDPAVRENYNRFSPHRFVQNWDTPILIIHGQKDYRVDVSEGMQAFTAARVQGIPARFLYFPDESHWVLHPQNGILWQRIFFDWLNRWLKP